MDLSKLLARRLDGSLLAIESLRVQLPVIATIAETIIDCLRNGGTLFTCGNGGSAAQAMHLSEELIGRYRSNRKPLSALCLNADATALTCIANDFGFDQVFSRQCATLLKPGDVLLALSTSGNSANIVNALIAARQSNVHTIGILGKNGGEAAAHCDHKVVVANDDSAFIQDAHQVIIHMLCEAVESAFR